MVRVGGDEGLRRVQVHSFLALRAKQHGDVAALSLGHRAWLPFVGNLEFWYSGRCVALRAASLDIAAKFCLVRDPLMSVHGHSILVLLRNSDWYVALICSVVRWFD